MPRASFHTLGCRLNQTESNLMAQSLKDIGYQIVPYQEGAELCVINTCTVTGQSDQKSRQAIRSIQKANPEALIAVVGCMSQMSGEEIMEIGGVDLVLGTGEKLNLASYVQQLLAGAEPIVAVGPIDRGSFSIAAQGQHLVQTRANLKIQDGCDFVCSFCIIPQARGRSRSRKLDNLLTEAEALVEAGVKEIILTGVNLGEFNEGGIDFLQLLDQFEALKLPRLRVSSIEPTTIQSEIFDRMKDPAHPLLPYLHLPLQAANDRILSMMRRRYSFAEFASFIDHGVKQVPNLGLGTDLLTAFPGETPSEFQEGYERVKDLPLHYFHVFPYAKREGARSANLAGEIAPPEAARRVELLRDLSDEKRLAFAQSQVGKRLEVLVEENGGGNLWQGYGENFLRVSLEDESPLNNQIHSVLIEGVSGNRAWGSRVK